MRNHLLRVCVLTIFCHILSLPVLAQDYYSYYGNKKMVYKAVANKIIISLKKDGRDRSSFISKFEIDSLQTIINDSLYFAIFKRLPDIADLIHSHKTLFSW
jgi:hypothetical protein